MNPFRNIFRLSVGDFLAKTLNFLAFVYLARVLGVSQYGVLEFAVSILTYLLVLADGGLELWATREAAQDRSVRRLAARVIPLRLLLAAGAFAALVALRPLLPDYANLEPVLLIFGLCVFAQALSLKWVFMGQEKMARVGGALVIGQIVFALGVFALVRDPSQLVWVAALRLASELAVAVYFARLFSAAHGGLRLALTLRGAPEVLRAAFTIGAAHALGLLNYNFDLLLLGFFLGPVAVGWYGAAYKPVTVALALPLTYFVGLFPALSRTYRQDAAEFGRVVARSIRLTSIFALPLGVGGAFFAGPVIDLLFGPAYANAVPALQILCWSAALVTLRGTYRQALNASGRSRLDLRCAGASAGLNVCLNLLLIPRYGIVGAAFTTLLAEVLWLVMASSYFYGRVARVRLLPLLLPPVVAAGGMALALAASGPLHWVARALVGLVVYLGALLLLGETEVRSWLHFGRARLLAFRVSS